MEETQELLKNNPFKTHSEREDYSKKAFQTYLAVLEEIKEKENLPDEEYNEIINLLEEVYLEKKITTLINSRLSNMSKRLGKALKFALSGSGKSVSMREPFTKIFYVKNQKGDITHEQF
jgi:hypothetical protein